MTKTAKITNSTAKNTVTQAQRRNARKCLAELISNGDLSRSTAGLTGDWNAHKPLWVLLQCVRTLRGALVAIARCKDGQEAAR